MTSLSRWGGGGVKNVHSDFDSRTSAEVFLCQVHFRGALGIFPYGV